MKLSVKVCLFLLALVPCAHSSEPNRLVFDAMGVTVREPDVPPYVGTIEIDLKSLTAVYGMRHQTKLVSCPREWYCIRDGRIDVAIPLERRKRGKVWSLDGMEYTVVSPFISDGRDPLITYVSVRAQKADTRSIFRIFSYDKNSRMFAYHEVLGVIAFQVLFLDLEQRPLSLDYVRVTPR
jgi:hypothetical protein